MSAYNTNLFNVVPRGAKIVSRLGVGDSKMANYVQCKVHLSEGQESVSLIH